MRLKFKENHVLANTGERHEAGQTHDVPDDVGRAILRAKVAELSTDAPVAPSPAPAPASQPDPH